MPESRICENFILRNFPVLQYLTLLFLETASNYDGNYLSVKCKDKRGRGGLQILLRKEMN